MIRTLLHDPRRWNVALVYLVAMCTTTSQGVIELSLPLNLDRIGFSLPLIGTVMAMMGLGSLLSRLPGGAWYALARARLLTSVFLVIFSVSTTGLGLSDLYEVQVVLSTIHGFAFGLVTTFLLAVVIEVRPRTGSAATTMAWYTAFISTGYAFGSILGAWALERFGFAGSFVASTLVGLAGAVLILALRSVSIPARARPARAERPSTAGRRARWSSAVPASVWLAAMIGFYINFVRDAYDTFFPIYAIGIGISLGTIGVMKSLHSLAASGIRFGSAVLLHFVSAGVVNHVSVIAIGLGVIALSVVTNEFMLMAIWVVLGVSRGLIRVTSATVVAEERERPGANVGLASGIYNAGLDAGGVFGPPLAGALAAALGIPTTFQLVAVVMLSLYYLIWFTQRAATRRNQSASPNPGLP